MSTPVSRRGDIGVTTNELWIDTTSCVLLQWRYGGFMGDLSGVVSRP
jgi:hypothetical protein